MLPFSCGSDDGLLPAAGRPGYDIEEMASLRVVLSDEQIGRLKEYVLDTPLVDVSATDVRRRVAVGLSILDMVPGRVGDYIAEWELYGGSKHA